MSMDGSTAVISSGVSTLLTPSPTEEVPDAWEETMSGLPFGEMAVYILMAAMVLFVCSALISVTTICYFCHMRKGKGKFRYKRTHRQMGVKARRRRRTTGTEQFESECEDGDGPEQSRDTNVTTNTINTSAFVNSVLSPQYKGVRPQYERVHSDRVGTIEEDDLLVLNNDNDPLDTLDTLAVCGLDVDVMMEQSRLRSAVMSRQLETNDDRLAEAVALEEHEETEEDEEETMDEADASDEAMYDEGFDEEFCGTRTNTMDTTHLCAGSAGTSSRHIF